MAEAELWVYLVDEDGRVPKLPARMSDKDAPRAGGADPGHFLHHHGAEQELPPMPP